MSHAYAGGKAAFLKRSGFGRFLLGEIDRLGIRRFVDGCCGSGAVAAFVGRERPGVALVCADAHPGAVELLRSTAAGGWSEPPGIPEHLAPAAAAVRAGALGRAEAAPLPEPLWRWLRERAWRPTRPAGDASALTARAGFPCSFGGRYFQGFARNSRGYSYAGAAMRSILRDAPALARADFVALGFERSIAAISPRPGDLWYFDPPYAGTVEYPGLPPFPRAAFAEAAEELAFLVPVIVSEYAAPAPGWRELWRGDRYVPLSGGVNEAASIRSDRAFAPGYYPPDTLRP